MTHHPGLLGQVSSSVLAHSKMGVSPGPAIQSMENSLYMVGGHGSVPGKCQAQGLLHRRCSVTVTCCYYVWKGDIGGDLHALQAGPGWPFLGGSEVI